jgi:transposase
MGGYKPAVWVSDRYVGQQDMAVAHQVCRAHVLRDIKYAIDCGNAVFAPTLAQPLASTTAVGRRRADLRGCTLQQYRARADRDLTGCWPCRHHTSPGVRGRPR